MAAKDLLNSAIHMVQRNPYAQAALGAGAGYVGANAFNHISPIDIDPEMALAVGAFGAPMLAKRRMVSQRPTEVIADPWVGSYRDRVSGGQIVPASQAEAYRPAPPRSAPGEDMSWDEWESLMRTID